MTVRSLNYTLHLLHHYFVIVAVAGFERNYTVNETDRSVEVCVLVTNPPPEQELVFQITLTTQNRNVTALGK